MSVGWVLGTYTERQKEMEMQRMKLIDETKSLRVQEEKEPKIFVEELT